MNTLIEIRATTTPEQDEEIRKLNNSLDINHPTDDLTEVYHALLLKWLKENLANLYVTYIEVSAVPPSSIPEPRDSPE